MCLKQALHTGGGPIFPSPQTSKKYYMKLVVAKDTNSVESTVSVKWNGTASAFVTTVSALCFIYMYMW